MAVTAKLPNLRHNSFNVRQSVDNQTVMKVHFFCSFANRYHEGTNDGRRGKWPSCRRSRSKIHNTGPCRRYFVSVRFPVRRLPPPQSHPLPYLLSQLWIETKASA
jgi:hypothetical protein